MPVCRGSVWWLAVKPLHCLSLGLVLLAAAGCSSGPGHSSAVAAPRTPQVAAAVQRQVVLVVDDQRQQLTTTAPTVQGVLTQAGVQLGPYDRVTPPVDAATPDLINVVRLVSAAVTKTVTIPAPTVRKKDSSVGAWTSKVVQKGKPGSKQVVVADAMKNGKRVQKVLQETVIAAPVPKIIAVGPTPGSVGGAAGRLNWAGLASCESGGDPHSVNPAGYYGLYQFSVSSWAAVGGAGLPSDASAAEQTYRAQLLYNRVGGRWQGQWPNCGPRLFG